MRFLIDTSTSIIKTHVLKENFQVEVLIKPVQYRTINDTNIIKFKIVIPFSNEFSAE